MAPRSCCLPLLVADTREHWSHQPLSVISYRCDSPVGSQTELASLCDWPRQTESSSGRQQQHTSPLQSRPVDDYAHMPTQPQTTAAPPMSSPSIAASSSPVGTEVDLNSSRAMCGTTQRDDDMNEVFLLLNFTDQSSEACEPQLGGKSLRWADRLEQDAHTRQQHTPKLPARPGRTCLRERPEAHVFPYLEEAEAFEGAVLLATTAEGSKDRRATFRRSIWRSGHKRSRRNCFK